IPDVILTLLTIFILAPLNEETLFRGIMLNVFRSRYCWTMWLGALITSLLFIDRNLNPQKTKKAPQNGCFFNTPCAPYERKR
ncbi:CPBP family intramembrane glutamic endopeptidase, partial [Escherichia coli]|uniref:CPBP family intramembrane glutamic endopeptidase n=1 Tax=Escherichia coli TaxID=562 RepID=UPI001F4238EB